MTETLAYRLSLALKTKGWQVTTAESCTGGLIAAALTEVAGSSTWFAQGIVSYSNAAKMRLLGVNAITLAQEGAVSEAVVSEMAQGALQSAQADLAVAVSGIAGPEGGSELKPVGTVCIAWADKTSVNTMTQHLTGDRQAVREKTVQLALQGLLERAL